MKPASYSAVIVILISALAPLRSQTPSRSGSAVLEAMKAELARSMEKLKTQPVPPYFISYEITESNDTAVTANFGALQYAMQRRSRVLDIDLRVGDYSLDNTRPIRGGRQFGSYGTARIELPLDDDPAAIRALLWYHTDLQYKAAVEQLTKVKTNIQVKVAQEDKSTDFSKEEPALADQAVPVFPVNLAVWKDRIRKYTAPFARAGSIYGAAGSVQIGMQQRWLVNSEGTAIHVAEPQCRIMISAFTKAADGMELPLYKTWFAFSPDGLPDDAVVLREVAGMIDTLRQLRDAPVVDPYTGPAILSGRASGVFFHEVFGHRVEGHRMKREEEGQTFKKKLNEQIIDPAFSVHFDPTVKRMAGVDLNGHYTYDNQGVAGRRVTVVDKGVLKTFLMSRTPIEAISHSNGHGRKQAGFTPVSRQSSLIVEAAPQAVHPDLKKVLIEQLKKENKPFGLYFEEIAGGFTMTGRMIPNAFNVVPLVVYRIYQDGRQEMVRGVDLIGTPLQTFTKIAGADSNFEAFQGTCGAESGGVPVSAVSPGIYVTQIEAQKKDKSQERPPVLPAPFAEAN